MSSSDRFIPDGQPSIITPIAFPCDSPKVLILNISPYIEPILHLRKYTAIRLIYLNFICTHNYKIFLIINLKEGNSTAFVVD